MSLSIFYGSSWFIFIIHHGSYLQSTFELPKTTTWDVLRNAPWSGPQRTSRCRCCRTASSWRPNRPRVCGPMSFAASYPCLMNRPAASPASGCEIFGITSEAFSVLWTLDDQQFWGNCVSYFETNPSVIGAGRPDMIPQVFRQIHVPSGNEIWLEIPPYRCFFPAN